MKEGTESPVSFSVWDAVTRLVPLENDVGAITTNDSGVCALRLPRGADLLAESPGVLVSSFSPDAIASDPRWHIWDALSTLGNAENIRDLRTLLASGGEACTLIVEGTAISALKFAVDDRRMVVGSTEPAVPVVLGVNLMPVPAVARVDWKVWRPGVDRTLR